jgi:DNA repair exonuclease SbcCD ATPase subunit
VISFPLLRHLNVQDYGLYPGTEAEPGLSVEFLPGVSLIIGANGLGKSTLVALLFRSLAGTSDISGGGQGQLGLRDLRPDELQTFAPRVADRGVDALATLTYTLGGHTITVTRSLRNLKLNKLEVDQAEIEPTEANYQAEVVRCSGLASFVDWLMVLRYLVFYGDDRRSLVWDPTVQRRVLRMLFLPGYEVEPNAELLNRILQQDSYYRNVSATLSRQERTLVSQEKAAQGRPGVEQRLDEVAARMATVDQSLEGAREASANLINERNSARLDALRTEEKLREFESRLEQVRLQQVRSSFPSQSETSAYWLTQIIAESRCIVCGNDVPDFGQELLLRIQRNSCPVCNSAAPRDPIAPDNDLLALEEEHAAARSAHRVAEENRSATELKLVEQISQVAQLEGEYASLAQQAEQLESKLPDSARMLNERREALKTLRLENETIRAQVLRDKKEYARLVNEQNLFIADYQQRIKKKFDEYAHDFLAEEISLVWGSTEAQIGQLGQPIRFSIFQVEMTGASAGSSRREHANQVSESQREFIDIAFRMALVDMAGTEGASTIVMDAPEGSLDAVFAPRAAEILSKFATPEGTSRMILTSNLVDGQLIPTLARLAGIAGIDDPRLLNLFEVAAPTAAVQRWASDYQEAMDRAFGPRGDK